MSQNQLNRRQMIAGSAPFALRALTGNSLGALFSSIVVGSVERALAAKQGLAPRRWLDMRFDYAPPRWVYDLFLRVSDEDQELFLANVNRQMATRYESRNGRYVDARFETVKIGDIQAPYLWQFDVPAPDGKSRPMHNLLKYFLNIRGIETGKPSHGGAQAAHFFPPGAAQGLAALSPDSSSRLFSAVVYNASNYALSSVRGLRPRSLPKNNPIEAILGEFSTPSATNEKERLVENYLDAVRYELSKSVGPRIVSSSLNDGVKEARELLNRGVGDLGKVWEKTHAKYADLVSRSLHSTFPGINDLPVGTASSRDFTYSIDSTSGIVKEADLRNIISPKSGMLGMAESFAVAEFVLINGFSNSVTVGIGPLNELQEPGRTLNYSFDEHYTGFMVSLFLNSLQSIAHAACLLELIEQLQVAGLWNETVINCSGEYNRTPATSGSGSHHGYQGASYALYSGCIDGPLFVGNVAKDATPAESRGTWGFGATQPEFKSRLDLGHAYNTIAVLLRVPPPLGGRPPLVKEIGNKIALTVAQGRVV